ncbi:MAG: signal peptidase II [Pirellulaceae bacterium]
MPVGRYLIYAALAVGGCAADLLTKQVVFDWRGWPGEQPIWWLVEGYVGIETSLNRGALFGMGSGFGLVFAGLSFLAAGGILAWLFYYRAANDLWLTIALGCITGGILGNLYDRLGFWHDPAIISPEYRSAVRDWILLRYKDHTWPNFNIADSLLVTGACLLMLHAWVRREPANPPHATGDDDRVGD